MSGIDKRISNWCNRMRVLTSYSDSKFSVIMQKVRTNCHYGEKYFCDGSVNKSIHSKITTPINPCPNYKNGYCKRFLHLSQNGGGFEK